MDSRLDILVPISGTEPDTAFAWLHADLLANGLFTIGPNIPTRWSKSIAIDLGDLNADGWPDLVVMEQSGSPPYDAQVLRAYLQSGAMPGTFSGPLELMAPRGSMLHVGDVNGDGLTDLIYSHERDIVFLPGGR
jgi:hypothetical protein